MDRADIWAIALPLAPVKLRFRLNHLAASPVRITQAYKNLMFVNGGFTFKVCGSPPLKTLQSAAIQAVDKDRAIAIGLNGLDDLVENTDTKSRLAKKSAIPTKVLVAKFGILRKADHQPSLKP